MKKLSINIPEGFEIDEANSNFSAGEISFKKKEFYLITEDGVKIYAGDRVCVLFEDDSYGSYRFDRSICKEHPNAKFFNIIDNAVNYRRDRCPKTWEDLSIIDGYYVDSRSIVVKACNTSTREYTKSTFPTKELAEASLALSQLLQLRDRYNDGWTPSWDGSDKCFTIVFFGNVLRKAARSQISRVMAFKDKRLRDEFLNNFKDLLEIAKPLL